MAAAVRIDLHGLGPGGGDAACVVVRLEVAFNDGHAKFGSQIRKRTLQQRRFARTGRAYEIQGKDAVFGELIFQACRQLSVGFKNITNDRYFHNKLLYTARGPFPLNARIARRRLDTAQRNALP